MIFLVNSLFITKYPLIKYHTKIIRMIDINEK